MTNSKRIMIEKIYSDKIVKYAANVGHITPLENPEITIEKRSIFCGSTIKVEIKTLNNTIAEYSQDVKACALGSTTASIISDNVIGASFDEVKACNKAMIDMLKNNGMPPNGRFAELSLLQSVKDYTNRHASTLLVLTALVSAIDKLENRAKK